MMNKPGVSIIIPCHNHAQYLQACLNSIKNQSTKRPLEIIVVDDSSQDECRLVTAKFGSNYLRVNYKNASAARNAGLKLASQPYVSFFDADNIMLPNYIEDLATPLDNNMADVAYGKRIIQYDNMQSGQYSAYNQQQYSHQDLIVHNQIDTACLVRQNVLNENPWDSNIQRYQDWDFHLSLMDRKVRYHFVDKIVLLYFDRDPNQHDEWYRSGQIRAKNVEYIRQKRKLAHRGNADFTVLLHTRGRFDIANHWFNSILAQDYPKSKINLVIADTSSDYLYYNEHLKPLLNSYHDLYNSIIIFPLSLYNHIYGNDLPNKISHEFHLIVEKVARRTVTTPYLTIVTEGAVTDTNALSIIKNTIDANSNLAGCQLLSGKKPYFSSDFLTLRREWLLSAPKMREYPTANYSKNQLIKSIIRSGQQFTTIENAHTEVLPHTTPVNNWFQPLPLDPAVRAIPIKTVIIYNQQSKNATDDLLHSNNISPQNVDNLYVVTNQKRALNLYQKLSAANPFLEILFIDAHNCYHTRLRYYWDLAPINTPVVSFVPQNNPTSVYDSQSHSWTKETAETYLTTEKNYLVTSGAWLVRPYLLQGITIFNDLALKCPSVFNLDLSLKLNKYLSYSTVITQSISFNIISFNETIFNEKSSTQNSITVKGTDFYYLGQTFARRIPIKNIIQFGRSTLNISLKARWWEKALFVAGVLNNLSLWMIPSQRLQRKLL